MALEDILDAYLYGCYGSRETYGLGVNWNQKRKKNGLGTSALYRVSHCVSTAKSPSVEYSQRHRDTLGSQVYNSRFLHCLSHRQRIRNHIVFVSNKFLIPRDVRR
jgi:hypothetical protein